MAREGQGAAAISLRTLADVQAHRERVVSDIRAEAIGTVDLTDLELAAVMWQARNVVTSREGAATTDTYPARLLSAYVSFCRVKNMPCARLSIKKVGLFALSDGLHILRENPRRFVKTLDWLGADKRLGRPASEKDIAFAKVSFFHDLIRRPTSTPSTPAAIDHGLVSEFTRRRSAVMQELRSARDEWLNNPEIALIMPQVMEVLSTQSMPDDISEIRWIYLLWCSRHQLLPVPIDEAHGFFFIQDFRGSHPASQIVSTLQSLNESVPDALKPQCPLVSSIALQSLVACYRQQPAQPRTPSALTSSASSTPTRLQHRRTEPITPQDQLQTSAVPSNWHIEPLVDERGFISESDVTRGYQAWAIVHTVCSELVDMASDLPPNQAAATPDDDPTPTEELMLPDTTLTRAMRALVTRYHDRTV